MQQPYQLLPPCEVGEASTRYQLPCVEESLPRSHHLVWDKAKVTREAFDSFLSLLSGTLKKKKKHPSTKFYSSDRLVVFFVFFFLRLSGIDI